jgi:integrase
VIFWRDRFIKQGIKGLYDVPRSGFRENGSRYKNHKLGAADVLTVAEARALARDFLARLARGEAPVKKKSEKKLLFGEFIETFYRPWVEENCKTWKEIMGILRSLFRFLYEKPIEELKKYELEQWRMKRQREGTKAATINRKITALKAALNWGVKQELIESNPLNRLQPLQERDSEEKVHYLSPDEKMRLLVALDEREAKMRASRESHNKWLSVRGKETLPTLGNGYADYLKPMVLLAMNSGMRRGSLFSLKWGDIDFATKIMNLRASTTKAGKTLRLPMNQTVIDTLTIWRQQSADTTSEALIFPSHKKKSTLMVDIKRSWEAVLKAAQIENFRFHDLRHDFASQLVMQGVDLNVVRELLGHADMKMTLRYAHLAPESKLRAVELLDA